MREDGEGNAEPSKLSVYSGWYDSLDFEEQICWAFRTVPSAVQKLYWANTLRDLKFKIKVTYGERQAEVFQTFETLCQTVSMAFGDSKDDPKPKKSKAYVPQTVEQMESAFNAVFG